MPTLTAKKYITAAVIHKQRDNLFTVDRAEKIADLARKYPPNEYKFIDITGKGEVPIKKGVQSYGIDSELTLDENNNWKWKKTDNQFEQIEKERKLLRLRYLMVDLIINKNQAETMGPDYSIVTTNLLALIAKTQKEIDDLVGT